MDYNLGRGEGRHERALLISYGALYMASTQLSWFQEKSILLNKKKKKSDGKISEGHRYECFLTLVRPGGEEGIHVIGFSGSHLITSRREQHKIKATKAHPGTKSTMKEGFTSRLGASPFVYTLCVHCLTQRSW